MITFPFSFFSGDSNANNFIVAVLAAGGTLNNAQKQGITTFVESLKANDLWYKFDAIYPIVGGTADSQKLNLKDPRNLDASYRLNFVGGWTHSSTGAKPNGTNAYANTFANLANATDFHLSFYSRTSIVNGGSRVSMGVRDASNNDYSLNIRRVGLTTTRAIASNSGSNDVWDYTDSSAVGYYIWTTETSTTRALYKNGSALSLFQNASYGSGAPNLPFFIGALNNNSTPDEFDTKECMFASLGNELNSTQAGTLNTLVQNLQIAMGRVAPLSIGFRTSYYYVANQNVDIQGSTGYYYNPTI